MAKKKKKTTETLPFEYVVGLEVHVQLKTQTKLFCGCGTAFGQSPNSQTCPVCLGLPGALPVMNRRAFQLSLRAALALNCEIASFTKWDRKNYYYPDLPKNYQISQFDLPFSNGGYLEIETEKGSKKIRLIRAHLEEDAGKMIHDEKEAKADSLVDLNRTGTPLLEIVSEPDISTPEEAKAYLEELRLLMREIGASDCEMQEGSLRCDANVNIQVKQDDGTFIPTPIVEVKNLNSFRSVSRAITHEGERQYNEWKKTGQKLGDVSKTTAGWDESKGVTVVQRRKEESADYRYFPDPDLVPVVVSEEWIAKAREEMGELPAEQRARLVEQYQLSEYDAGVISRQGRKFVAYFEQVSSESENVKVASNWMTNQVMATLNEQKCEIDSFPLSASRLAELIREDLPAKVSRDVYAKMLESESSPKEIMNELGIKIVSDPEELRAMVRAAIEANPKAAEDYKNGKTKAADAIKGVIMKETKGMARMELVQQIVTEELQQ